MKPSTRLSRRSFLKICAAGSAAGIFTACGQRSRGKGIQPLTPTDQSSSNLITKATPPSGQQEAPKLTPPANTKLHPNWTRGKVPRERTLIYNGAGTDYPDCNPFHWGGQLGGQLWEGFAYYSAASDKTILWMLENYQYSSDATELIIKLRPGIEWSDGKAFSTRDVKFSLETLMRLGLSEIAGFNVVDDLTLRINLQKPDWRFFNRNLVYCYWQGDPRWIVPEHIFKYYTDQQLQYGYIIDPKTAEKFSTFFDPERNYPVVTGPYMIVKTDPEILKEFNYRDLNMYDLRPDWWAVKTGLVARMPDVERVITVMLDESPEMQVKQFTENMVDFCRSYRVGPEAIRDILEQAPEISTWTGHNPPYGHIAPHVGGLGFNCQQAPFDDPRLRWAIAYALDQKSILEEVYGRDVEVAESPFPGYPVFQKLLSEIDDLVREYNFIDYDPAKSTQWMQEAGYQKNAAGLWAGQNGARIGLTLYADGTNTWYYVESYAKMASKIVEELRQAGFDCQLKLFEESPQEAAEQGGIEIEDTYTIAAKGHAPLFILDSLGMGINDPVDLFMDYQPEHILPVGGYSSNLTRWVDDSFTKATDELLKLSPQDPRALESFRKCMEIWYQNLSFIPLFQTYHRVPYNTRYWTNWPSAENPYAELAFSSHGALLLVINLKAQT